jgi:hypothetical protein
MEKGTKVIILVVVCAVLIIGLIVYFVASNKNKAPVVDQANAPIQKVELPKDVAAKIIVPPPTDQERQISAVKNIALSFVERFGTYTNESNYQSFNDLMPVLTASSQAWLLNTYIPSLVKEHDPRGFFYRIITDARTADIIEQKDTMLKMRVATQREETKGEAPAESFIQNIVLDLVKENNNWLINGVYWEKR